MQAGPWRRHSVRQAVTLGVRMVTLTSEIIFIICKRREHMLPFKTHWTRTRQPHQYVTDQMNLLSEFVDGDVDDVEVVVEVPAGP